VDADSQSFHDDTATGFMFGPATSAALADALTRCLEAWRQPARWRQLVLRGMSQNFSWDASASQYMTLYREVSSVGESAGLS
jgi:starch synthase